MSTYRDMSSLTISRERLHSRLEELHRSIDYLAERDALRAEESRPTAAR